jgi:hypothetical protein
MQTMNDQPVLFTETCGAHLSPCRTYRYSLWRVWEPDKGVVAFCGLNPSTADETVDDPTIRRCIGFARDWGYGGLYMLNLFAFRATDPKDMKAATDPVGPSNDAALAHHQKFCRLTVAAWGVHGTFKGRAEHVLRNVLVNGPVKCLGRTKDGCPKHPLYLPKSASLVEVTP